MARLIWKKSDAPGDEVSFPLGAEPLTVGRDPACPIFIDAPLLSREHARLEFRDGRHVVVDLGSTNFTRVNGVRVGEQALADGDEILFSRARCLYEA